MSRLFSWRWRILLPFRLLCQQFPSWEADTWTYLTSFSLLRSMERNWGNRTQHTLLGWDNWFGFNMALCVLMFTLILTNSLGPNLCLIKAWIGRFTAFVTIYHRSVPKLCTTAFALNPLAKLIPFKDVVLAHGTHCHFIFHFNLSCLHGFISIRILVSYTNIGNSLVNKSTLPAFDHNFILFSPIFFSI